MKPLLGEMQRYAYTGMLKRGEIITGTLFPEEGRRKHFAGVQI
jgi:hypothetical protein